MNAQRENATIQLLAWLKKFSPEAYSAVIARVGDPPGKGIYAAADSWDLNIGQNGVVTAEEPGWFDWAKEAISVVKEVVPTYFQYKTQTQIMDMNITRAEQGLPPIDPGVIAPQVKVIHDVPLEYREVIEKAGLNVGNMLLWGALGLGAFMLIRTMR